MQNHQTRPLLFSLQGLDSMATSSNCDSLPVVVPSLIYANGNCARIIDAHICFVVLLHGMHALFVI